MTLPFWTSMKVSGNLTTFQAWWAQWWAHLCLGEGREGSASHSTGLPFGVYRDQALSQPDSALSSSRYEILTARNAKPANRG